MTEPATHKLDVPGAILTYDVRRSDSTTEPPLLLIGSPMGASGFGTLASYFHDRTVVTYDPRGVERSQKTDGVVTSAPEQHADDIHAVIEAVGRPVDIFASSGGAVNALALVARHSNDVRTLVAHEPPAAAVVPDRENALAACRAVNQTYMEKGFGYGMARFIATTAFTGPFPADFATSPDPDPQMFGMSPDDDGKRDDALMAQNMVTCTAFQPDFDALRSATTRIVIAAGVESEGQLASRAGHAVAERLGLPVTTFPSGHGGFLGNEYGMPGEPEAFATTLRQALAADGGSN